MLVASWANATAALQDEEFLVISVGGVSIPIPMPPHIDYFNATRETVAHGEVVTLSWDTYKADSLSLNGVQVELSGSQSIAITVSGSYTLTMTSEVSSTSHTIDIVKDTDNDGFKDETDIDDDNDGLLDTQEIAAGLNPYDASDARLDNDGDGIRNDEEVLLGFDHNDVRSFPGLFVEYFRGNKALIREGEGVVLSWKAYGAAQVNLKENDNLLIPDLASRGVVTVKPKASSQYTLEVVAAGDKGTFEKSWMVTMDNNLPSQQWLDTQLISDPVTSSLVALDDASAFIGSFSGGLYHLDSKGELLWQDENFGLVMSAPVVANNILYVTSTHPTQAGKGKLTAIDTQSHAIRWSLALDNPGVAELTLNSAQTLGYVVDYQGVLYEVDTATGALNWQLAVTGSKAVRVAPGLSLGEDTLFIRTTDNKLIARDIALSKAQALNTDGGSQSENDQSLGRPGGDKPGIDEDESNGEKWSREFN